MNEIRKPYASSLKKSIDTCKDPYLPKGGSHDMAECKHCQSIYHNKRWYRKEGFDTHKMSLSSTRMVICPACQKIKDNFPGGIVTLTGDFLQEHKKDILNLIRNEEERARDVNPLERIIKINNDSKKTEISTTNEKLAQRIGRKIKKAFSGEVEYKWSQGTKLLRVVWSR
jgi:NMD protein affecting ribosome stability and mRNA decay